jgi:hypothetical protein
MAPYQKDHESNEQEPGGSPPARLEATANEEDDMKFGMLGVGTMSPAMVSKHVVALSHYQTQHRDTPLSLDNDVSAAR